MAFKTFSENAEHGKINGMSIDNTGADERPNFGAFNIRKNPLYLASSRAAFTIKDTVQGRATAREALEKGMHVFDLAGNELTAEDLTEKA